jgi:hypothetical protein
MHHSLALAAPLALALCASAAHAQEPAAPPVDDTVHWKDLLGTGIKFKLYGFLRTDAQWSDSRFNDIQIPGYVQSEDPAAPPSVGASDDDSDFALHARLTRFGMNLAGPTIEGLGNPDLTGNVEIDFYNIGLGDSDSRSAVRMRKAYLKLDWTHWSLLAGQDWDVISPLYPAVNADLVMWGAGNTGDRRPQVTAEYKTDMGAGQFVATFGVGLSGAVAGATAEGGLRSGENSGEPMLNARLGYSGKTDAGGAYQFGVWGHSSKEDYDAISAGNDQSYDSSSIGVDVKVPIVGDSTWLLGEYWSGKNVDDIRGGIFQGVNPTTGAEIQAEGGFLELGTRLTDHMSMHLGYSIDDPDDADLDPNQRAKNKVGYAAARWSYGALRYGVEYLNWTTEYVGLDDGDANRVQAFLAFYF